jgi:hypothetical protein
MKNKTQRTTEPIKYPLTLKKFLILMLPALYNKPNRREAAWRVFRNSDHALGHHFSIQGGKWWTMKQLADHINKTKEIPDEGIYWNLAKSFGSWYGYWRPQTTSDQNKQKALKRHKKTGARPNRVALKEISKSLLT